MEFIFAIKIGLGELCQPAVIVCLDGPGVKGHRPLPASKLLEAAKQHGGIADPAHGFLVGVHAFQVVHRIAGKQRVRHLHHIAELLEGNAQAMDRGRISGVQLMEGLEGSGVGLIHGLFQALEQAGFPGAFSGDEAHLLCAVPPVRRLGGSQVVAGRARQALHLFLKIGSKLHQLRQALGPLRHFI